MLKSDDLEFLRRVGNGPLACVVVLLVMLRRLLTRNGPCTAFVRFNIEAEQLGGWSATSCQVSGPSFDSAPCAWVQHLSQCCYWTRLGKWYCRSASFGYRGKSPTLAADGAHHTLAPYCRSFRLSNLEAGAHITVSTVPADTTVSPRFPDRAGPHHTITRCRGKDQLNIARASGAAFEEFQEGPLCFPPTYKYIPGTQDFDNRQVRSNE